MNRPWRRRAAPLLMAAGLMALGLPARACGYDGLLPDLVAAHPQSIGVALALRDAYDRQQLAVLDAVPSAVGFLRAHLLLQRFSPMVVSAAAPANGAAGGSVAAGKMVGKLMSPCAAARTAPASSWPDKGG